MKKNKLIISFIGCGFSANSILYHLNQLITKIKNKNTVINLFDFRDTFGDGIAYSVKNSDVLINRPAHEMSIDHKNLSHYKEWMKNKREVEEYERRDYFGQYLCEILKETTCSLTSKGITVNNIQDLIFDIKNINGEFYLKSEKNDYKSDIVILSTGNNSQTNILNIVHKNYIDNLYYEFQKLEEIDKKDDVLVIGSSLSAIDSILKLEKNKHTGKIICVSRSGILPKIRKSSKKIDLTYFQSLSNEKKVIRICDIIESLDLELKKINPNLKLRELFNCNKFEKDILKAEIGKDKDYIQRILTSTNPYIEEIWGKLDDADKLMFFQKYYTIYMSHRNPMPPVSARRLLPLIVKKQLRHIQGHVNNIEIKENHFVYKETNKKNHKVKWIINATGQSKDIEDNKLYKEMLNVGLISKNIFGGIQMDRERQLCINKNGDLVKNLYVIGPKTLGNYINVNSAEMLSITAEKMAKTIFQSSVI